MQTVIIKEISARLVYLRMVTIQYNLFRLILLQTIILKEISSRLVYLRKIQLQYNLFRFILFLQMIRNQKLEYIIFKENNENNI